MEVLRLRWALAPGDVLVIDSTSGAPAKQFFCIQLVEKIPSGVDG